MRSPGMRCIAPRFKAEARLQARSEGREREVLRTGYRPSRTAPMALALVSGESHCSRHSSGSGGRVATRRSSRLAGVSPVSMRGMNAACPSVPNGVLSAPVRGSPLLTLTPIRGQAQTVPRLATSCACTSDESSARGALRCKRLPVIGTTGAGRNGASPTVPPTVAGKYVPWSSCPCH
jgi:hypothetical protein